MKKQPVLLFSALVALSACEPIVANRGSMLDPEIFAEIKPGQTTREEVATKVGTPTSISTFDENVWYYVGRQTEQYSFFTPDVLKQQAYEIDFNDEGVVTDVTPLDLSQAADASPVDRETPTFGQQNNVLREILGTLSHPSPRLTKERGSGT